MGPGFESLRVYQGWPIGQVVKTAASHAVNIGSNPVWVSKNNAGQTVIGVLRFVRIEARQSFDIKRRAENPSIRVGIDGDEGPPVPIPNTEVKIISADNTGQVTAREDR